MNDSHSGAAVFFFLPFVVAIIGALVHTRRRDAHGVRALELWLVWWLVACGVGGLLGAFGHVGPSSGDIADGIGYTQSMFQWEVGWADLGIAVLLIGTLWRRDLGWLTAAVVMWSVSYGGDAIGHAMQWIAHDNTAPSNVWALPADVIGPLVAVLLLVAYTRAKRAPRTEGAQRTEHAPATPATTGA